jgi:hypothetical protein
MTPLGSVASLVTRVRAWPVESQQVARRNAMIASTNLAQRRKERDEVEDFFAARFGSAAGPVVRIDAAR